MKNAQVYIISADLLDFENKEGERIVMTRIQYAINMSNTDTRVGYSTYKCSRRGNHLEFIKPYIMKPVTADIEERPTEDGVKYVLNSINKRELK